MRKTLLLFVAALCLGGCSSLKVIPEPIDGGTINTKDGTQALTKDGLAVTAGNAEISMYSENLEGAVSAFYVTVENQTDGEVNFSTDSFLLVDNDNRQYQTLTPEKVKEIVSKDTYYLIPYPYVGFYYLEDYQRTAFYNRFNSREPYFYELYPQDIFTKGFPSGGIIPKAKAGGLVYFRLDVKDKKSVKLLVYRNPAAKSAAPDFAFPFRISTK